MSRKTIRFRLLLLAICLCGAVRLEAQQTEQIPNWSSKFEDYAASADFKGKPAAPILATKGDRMFRTQIRDAARKGPNFAGHYTIAEWGCGSGCVSLAVVDAVSGKVFAAPFKNLALPLQEGGREYQGPV